MDAFHGGASIQPQDRGPKTSSALIAPTDAHPPVWGRSSISQHCSRALAFDGSDLAGLLPALFKTPRALKREGVCLMNSTQ